MKILLTGATGFVGQHLISQLLKEDHQLTILTRNPKEAEKKWKKKFSTLSPESKTNAVSFSGWDAQSLIPHSTMAGLNAVIHLAGEPLHQGRWNRKKKHQILESRRQGTKFLISSIDLGSKPQVVLSASAIGGDQEEQILTSAAGQGFLSEVTQIWENEFFKHEEKWKKGPMLRTPQDSLLLEWESFLEKKEEF